MTPFQISGISSMVAKTPSRWASIGLVDNPPPTQTSNPGPNSGWTTPTKEMSLISWATSCRGDPEMAVLNLRGRLENSSDPMNWSRIACMAGVPSMISSAAIPASGEPRTTRGTSPQASAVEQPDAFESFPDVRDVFDADPVQLDVLAIGEIGRVAGVLRGDLADGAERSRGQQTPVDADPQHEERILQLVRLEHRGAAAVDAGRSLRVEAPPAKTPPQVARINAIEAGVAVDVLDPGPAVQTVVVLLHPLVRIQRLTVTHGPLTLAPAGVRPLAGRTRCAGHRCA